MFLDEGAMGEDIKIKCFQKRIHLHARVLCHIAIRKQLCVDLRLCALVGVLHNLVWAVETRKKSRVMISGYSQV